MVMSNIHALNPANKATTGKTTQIMVSAETTTQKKTKELPDVYRLGFDPKDKDAPGCGDGLPYVEHTVFNCVKLCGGDHLAALLLYKLIYRCRYARLLIGEYRWFVRSRARMCEDLTCTRHQYDRALKVLKDKGFVQTRHIPLRQQHVFGAYTAFRVSIEAIEGLRSITDDDESDQANIVELHAFAKAHGLDHD
jgi:hypothetical protein